MKKTDRQLMDEIINSGKHLWIPTDVLFLDGVRFNRDSNHPDYRHARRILIKLEKEGILHSRNFPSVNLTVYWRVL